MKSCRLLAALLVVFTLAALSADAAPIRKKLIEAGWDMPDTARLRANIATMEQTPFDGVVVRCVSKKPDGTTASLSPGFAATPWEAAWFDNCIEDLKATPFKRLTDNFVHIGANPGNVDWFDDEGFKAVVEHFRIAARVAKLGGVKGILFDPEPYNPPHAQFKYSAQPQKAEHTFAEYYAKARERGREVMQAVTGEYPEVTIYTFFANSINGTAMDHPDPVVALLGSHYGLYPPFVDGWLDVIPPTVTIVDGCEHAYLFNSDQQYLQAALKMKLDAQSLVSPENRAKYRAQVQGSYGIYLDAYANPPDSRWYVKAEGPRDEVLRRNVSSALRAADEYVWVYGEKHRWWDTPNKGVNPTTWDEAMPGTSDALRMSTDPNGYARAKLAEAVASGKAVNLARNGDFASDKAEGAVAGTQVDWKTGGAPAGWNTWQEPATGKFEWDRETGGGAAKASGVATGCFIQQITPVEPGQTYVVQARYKLQGNGNASIRLRWQTPEGQWIQEQLDKMAYGSGKPGGWEELTAVAEVPEGVGRLVILLGASSQSGEGDVVWYDDVKAYRLK